MAEQKNRRSVKATGVGPTRPDLRIAFVKGVFFLALVLGLVLTSVAALPILILSVGGSSMKALEVQLMTQRTVMTGQLTERPGQLASLEVL